MMDKRFLPPIAALRAFEAVGRLGGIRRAAEELGVDHAVVSRHVRSLESLMETPLMIREGQASRLTDEGAEYHDKISAALNMIVNATAGVLQSEGERELRVWCSPGFALLWLSGHIGEFISANPDLDVEFRPADNLADFRSREVDCDIRYLRDWQTTSLPKILHRADFSRPSVFPVASPQFVEAMNPIEQAGDMLDLPLLHEESNDEWRYWLEAQGVDVPAQIPGARLWQAHLTLSAARKGHGIALANRFIIGDALTTGDLVEIRPVSGEFAPVSFGAYTFLAREEEWNADHIRRFRRWLQDVSL